ncbi:MAG: phosphoglycerate dehydrogenase [Bacteriovoracaceae bacterium]|nr:phosphoglycerate dehydrogenase [Bacteriovoracaceae bacterium]
MKLAVTSASFSKNKYLRDEVSSKWRGKIKYNIEGIRFTKSELIIFLDDADAVIVGLDQIDLEVLESLPKLKYISKYGVGLDNVDLKACAERGIPVGWTGGVNKLSVAEMTIGFAISLIRNLYQTSSLLSRGEWKKVGGRQLSHKTVGLIGFGNVGKEVYRLLEPFNCKILINDIDTNAFNGYSLKNSKLERIFKESDIISIHTPLSEKTQNLITIKEMRTMKQKPFLINTARGGIINESDLEVALDEGHISGLAIDAFIEEPYPPHSLIERENVYCTPHIGGNADEAVMAMGKSAIDNLLKITKG